MQFKIYTEHLVLQQIQELDVPFLTYCMTEAEAHGPFLTGKQLTKEEVALRVRGGAYWNEDAKLYVIKRKDDLTRIGIIHYWVRPDDRRTATYAVEIALPEQRNLGYGTEAQLALIRMLFTQSRVEAVESYTDIRNRPQIRVLEKLGFHARQTEAYSDFGVERTGHCFHLDRDLYEKLWGYLR